MLRVSGLMSTNTATAPLNTNALAVDANVNDGMITSSPGWISQSSAVISRAAVPDGVRRTSGDPVLADSQSLQSFVNGPSPDSHPVDTDSAMNASSRPVMYARLNGIFTNRSPQYARIAT